MRKKIILIILAILLSIVLIWLDNHNLIFSTQEEKKLLMEKLHIDTNTDSFKPISYSNQKIELSSRDTVKIITFSISKNDYVENNLNYSDYYFSELLDSSSKQENGDNYLCEIKVSTRNNNTLYDYENLKSFSKYNYIIRKICFLCIIILLIEAFCKIALKKRIVLYVTLLALFSILIIVKIHYFSIELENKENIESTENIIKQSLDAEDNNRNEIDEENIDINDSIINITNDIEENPYYNGIITEISADNIVFENQSSNEKYLIDINSDFKFINGRTNEEININDIEVGYYIDTYTYKNSRVISILSNIKGEELKKELMKNFTLENPIYLTVSPVGTNMEIVNKNKAILTITFDDLLSDYNNDGGKFEMKIEINSNTVIECKGGINKIEELGDVALDIIKLKLDKNTIDNEIPVATWFMSNNGD